MLAKLEVFEAEVVDRGRIGASLSWRLQSAGIICTPQLAAGKTSLYAQFTIQVEQRLAVQQLLKQRGILTAVHYPTLLYQQPAMVGYGNCVKRCKRCCGCPAAHTASERKLSLPICPYLSEADQDLITNEVAAATGVCIFYEAAI